MISSSSILLNIRKNTFVVKYKPEKKYICSQRTVPLVLFLFTKT